MSMLMPEFRLARPRALDEAIAARRENGESAWLAGGTDLMVNVRHGLEAPTLLVDLSEVSELRGLEIGKNGARIGAGVTIAELEGHAPVGQFYRAVQQAAAAIAGPGLRRMGSVGGNLCLDTRCVYYNQSEWWRHANGYCLKHRGDVCHVAPQGNRCHAAFTGDLAPALLVFGAEIEVAGPDGRRWMPLADLYVEDGRAHLSLRDGEIIIAVRLPPPTLKSAYRKVRVRDAIDYPLAGVAVALALDGKNIQRLRIALTGTNSRPFVLEGTEALLGKAVNDDTLTQIDRLVQKQVQPMRTTVISAQYRRLAAAAIARKLVNELALESEQ
ncbi:MAG: 4-hydroxybenzoyl-CoA reductase subunit beta [Pseudorhodoplanes sp.]|jgi:4-hydroxybenzoyl-CoA reductase subunit beta|nr:4-hydroxybenzoyl-CoA reductase subunit beta [Pseudorhodoplanes sp.]